MSHQRWAARFADELPDPGANRRPPLRNRSGELCRLAAAKSMLNAQPPSEWGRSRCVPKKWARIAGCTRLSIIDPTE